MAPRPLRRGVGQSLEKVENRSIGGRRDAPDIIQKITKSLMDRVRRLGAISAN